MKKRVLIVDDEKNIRLTVSRSLQSDSIDVDQASSAEEALEFLSLGHYDLMLLDLRLPGMDGAELIQQLKELGIVVKTIIISAHGTIDTAVRLLKDGALDYVEKPFSPQEIRSIVDRYL
jgi:DNA-binding NtrC family response regulator